MQSSLLMQLAMEIFQGPWRRAAFSLGTALLISGLSASSTCGQEYVVESYQSAGHTSDKGGEEGEEGTIAEPEGEAIPEIADFNGDVAYASGSQSAVPNSIGDSIGGLYHVGSSAYNFGGGRRFKAANDQSPLPQDRVFYDYHYYKNAFAAAGVGTDVQHHVFGFEKTFWCGMASIQLQAPIAMAAQDFVGAAALNDTVFGDLAVAVKGIVYQDACSTLSVGLGVDLPTADDITGPGVVFNNEAVLLSPFVAYYQDLGCCYFAQTYVQAVLPVSDDEVNGVDIDQVSLLYIDVSGGRWLRQDGCGNGVAAIAELHYTTNLESQQVNVGGILSDDLNVLNATFGVQVIENCWRITPAFVLPVLENDANHRQFDWEAMVQVNRMF